MQAIRTQILPATNHKGARIKATCARGSLTVGTNDTSEEGHRNAANLLVRKFLIEDQEEYGTPAAENPWRKSRVTGCLPDGSFAHVYTGF